MCDIRCERLIEDGRRLGLINERDVETWQMSRVVLPEAKELTLSMGALPVQLNLLVSFVLLLCARQMYVTATVLLSGRCE